jgi:predicted RNA-binding protein with PUA-like domain
MGYWLFKSEPSEFSIDDLAAMPGQVDHWDGVRNYQVRNMLRDQMRRGDQAFFYHSSTTPLGIVGIVEIVRDGYPDTTAFDPDDSHYDPKSDPDNPRWFMVDVRFVRKLRRTITLDELKTHPALHDFPLVRRGNRLSIVPVSGQQWELILTLE